MKPFDILKFILAAAGTTELAKAPNLALRRRKLAAFLASGAKLVFPAAERPRASIIIPVFNGAYHTLECLRSILAVADGSYEVIVVDDGSGDETGSLLARCENLRAIKNLENLGFLRSVNAGAGAARGEFLVFINNDARLISGSLAAACDLYDAEENCGYMGARVAHVGGGLQEAGCMIFQDGITNGYLRYQPRDDLRALFQRDVDYCSGVFAIVARRHFTQLGGFDEAFAPAYFEETDFCMRLRQRGLRCIYNPRLLVDHFEFGSSRKAKSARSRIEERRAIFLTRWSGTLRREGYLPAESPDVIERAALRLLPRRRKLLILGGDVAEDTLLGLRPEPGLHITAFLVTSNDALAKLLVAKMDMSVAFASGDAGDLIRYLRSRWPAFSDVELVGKEANRLRNKLPGSRESAGVGG